VLFIAYQHPCLFSSIGRQHLLKLSSNNNSVTMANYRTHVHLLTLLFRFPPSYFNVTDDKLRTIFNGQFKQLLLTMKFFHSGLLYSQYLSASLHAILKLPLEL